MARNQKRETVELRWRRIGLVMLAVAAIATLTVGYVLQRRAHDELGTQIKATERKTSWTVEAINIERIKLNRLLSKEALQRRAAEMQLGLTNIPSNQRRAIPLMLDEPSEASPGLLATTNRSASLVPIRPLAAVKLASTQVNR